MVQQQQQSPHPQQHGQQGQQQQLLSLGGGGGGGGWTMTVVGPAGGATCITSTRRVLCSMLASFDWFSSSCFRLDRFTLTTTTSCCCTSHDSRGTARNARSLYYSLHIANLLRLALLSALSVDKRHYLASYLALTVVCLICTQSYTNIQIYFIYIFCNVHLKIVQSHTHTEYSNKSVIHYRKHFRELFSRLPINNLFGRKIGHFSEAINRST